MSNYKGSYVWDPLLLDIYLIRWNSQKEQIDIEFAYTIKAHLLAHFCFDPSIVLESFWIPKPLQKDISNYFLLLFVECGYVGQAILCFHQIYCQPKIITHAAFRLEPLLLICVQWNCGDVYNDLRWFNEKIVQYSIKLWNTSATSAILYQSIDPQNEMK